FLDRIWRLFIDENDYVSSKVVDENGEGHALEKIYHQTVKKVTEDFEELRFNTAISQMMVFINDAYKVDTLPKQFVEGFIQLLAPIVPHIGEEIWSKLGHTSTISYAAWPTCDESKLVENEVEIVVQVNGKVKVKLHVAKDATREQME